MTYKKTGQFQAIQQNLLKVAACYGYSDFSFTTADSGIENSTYIIKSTDTFVLRVYRYAKKSDADIMREIDFMKTLHDHDVLVPGILPNTSGEYVSKITIDGSQWSAIAMEFIPGHHPTNYTSKIIDQLAASHAAMHQIGIQYAQEIGAKPQLKLQPGEFTDHIDDDTLENESIKALIGRARSYAVTLDKTLEYGYVHNDYDIENTLFDDKDNLLSILDFDDLVVMPVVVCLAFSLWSVFFETDDLKLVRHYLDVYIKSRALTPLEQLYIPRILLFRHYAISSLLVLDDEMDDDLLQTCEKIETFLLEMVDGNSVIE